MSGSTLIREVRLLDPTLAGPAPAPRDVRIVDGVVAEIGDGLGRRPGETVHEGHGRWAVPGLWDAHVHLGQWAATTTRLDLSGAADARAVCALVARHVAATADQKGATVAGFGYRSPTWPEPPTVAALDAVCADRPVVLISGDCHAGWLNTRALELLGLPLREGVVWEHEWFDTFPRLDLLPGLGELTTTGYRRAVEAAAAKGVVGVVDLEFARGFEQWPGRVEDGIDSLRVRIGTYSDGLDDVVAAGLRTGSPIGDSGLLAMGPLKIISDGSLNTRTAYCCEPYADVEDADHPHGVQNVPPAELRRLLGTAHGAGLEVALHAIGDAAVRDALDAFEVTGARGSIEHAQLMDWQDIPRMGRLGVRASVQPAHLWDDRDVTRRCWPGREARCFPFRSLTEAGVSLTLGSDAPVSPLDPWLAMAAAVHRSADEREPWVPEQALTPAEALAASTDGQGAVHVGGRGDVVILESDPLALPQDSGEAAAALLGTRPLATILAGRLTFSR